MSSTCYPAYYVHISLPLPIKVKQIDERNLTNHVLQSYTINNNHKCIMTIPYLPSHNKTLPLVDSHTSL